MEMCIVRAFVNITFVMCPYQKVLTPVGGGGIASVAWDLPVTTVLQLLHKRLKEP